MAVPAHTKPNLTLQLFKPPKSKKASPCGASLLLSHALLVRGVGFGAFTILTSHPFEGVRWVGCYYAITSRAKVGSVVTPVSLMNVLSAAT